MLCPFVSTHAVDVLFPGVVKVFCIASYVLYLTWSGVKRVHVALSALRIFQVCVTMFVTVC